MLRLALSVSLLAVSASAQQNVIVIPRDAQVVVAPRGATPPVRTPPPAPAAARAAAAPAGQPTVLAPGAVGLAPVAGIALPLIATAILGGTLAGSRGGGAPAQTR